MTKPNGYTVIPLLNSLASDWSNGRGCTVDRPTSGATSNKEQPKGPGFLYRWNDSGDPVLITFVPEGLHQTSTEEDLHHLFLRATIDGLSIKTADHPAQSIKFGNPAHIQQLEEIILEARSCQDREHPDTLSSIIAAQRLIALGRHGHTNGANGKTPSKVPLKHRFVDELHEWLSGQLENSLKLGDAAKQFKKSPRQLIRILKETTGSGFAEHLTMHRLTLARTLLMRTDTSILEVAKKSGFNSREQFIRSFSKAFAWTPLQFRKAWNKASLSNSDLRDLCQISERTSVSWHAPDQAHTSPPIKSDSPVTLVVANALHEIVELFSIDENGRQIRSGVLDRGAMSYINRDTEGSQWLVRTPGTEFERIFSTPNQHAFAVVSSDL